MSQLSISDNQNTQILAPVNTALENAFASGTSATSTPNVLAPIQQYNTLTVSTKQLVKDSFRMVVAALMSVLNIDRPLPAVKFSGTVVLAKLTSGGANGSFSVTDGIITAYTPPS